MICCILTQLCNVAVSRAHPGVLATKVGYFGVKSAKVPRGQMGT